MRDLKEIFRFLFKIPRMIGELNMPIEETDVLQDIRHIIHEWKEYKDLEEQCIKENSFGLKMLLHKWKEFFEDIQELYEYRKLEKQGKDDWIPCSERLPEEPEEIPTEDEPVEEMMLDGKFREYIVAIWGADESTTLYYIGNNEWYDGISGTYYKVIAWQPMPEVYKGLDH